MNYSTNMWLTENGLTSVSVSMEMPHKPLGRKCHQTFAIAPIPEQDAFLIPRTQFTYWFKFSLFSLSESEIALSWMCDSESVHTNWWGGVKPCTVCVQNGLSRNSEDYFLRSVNYYCSADLIQNVCTHSALIPILPSYALLHLPPSALPTRMWFHSFKHFLVWFTLSHWVFVFFLFLITTDALSPRRYIHLFIYSLFFQILFISDWEKNIINYCDCGVLTGINCQRLLIKLCCLLS